MAKPAAILDIGSSKIVCMCASPVSREGMNVHAVAVSPFQGYRDGRFEDEEDLRQAVVEAVQKVEQESRVRVRDIAVSVPAPFVKLIATDASIPIQSRSRRVDSADIDSLITESLRKARAPGYVLMHSTPVSFTVNGVESSEVPEGVRTDQIAGLVSHMYVQEEFVRAMERALSAIHVEISMCVSATLAEALLIIPERERVRPAILIDVGYLHTDVAIVENAALTHIATVDAGGYHFTADLSFGLDVPMEAAEQVKRRYVFGQDAPLSNTEIIRMPSGAKKVDHSVIELIMEARSNELVGLIRKTLLRLGVNQEAYPTTYLTGGGVAMIKGSGEFFKSALQLPVKRDMPYMPDMNTPNYTSAFGTMDFVLRATGQDYGAEAASPESSVLDKLRNFFTK